MTTFKLLGFSPVEYLEDITENFVEGIVFRTSEEKTLDGIKSLLYPEKYFGSVTIKIIS